MTRKNLFEIDPSPVENWNIHGLNLKPRHPEAYNCASGIYYGESLGKNFQVDEYLEAEAKETLIKRVQEGDYFFLAEVANYLEYFENKDPYGNKLNPPMDDLSVALHNIYARKPEGWKPRPVELLDLLALNLEDGHPSEKTVKARCKALGLPIDSSSGRPRRK